MGNEFGILVQSMEYVVLRTGGKQYKVKKSDIIEIDNLPYEKGKEVVFEDVLLWVRNGILKVGTPKVQDIKIKARVLDHIKGKKIRVAKFKAKVRYRRVMGFRPILTRLQITDIESLETKEKPKASASKTVLKRPSSMIDRKTFS